MSKKRFLTIFLIFFIFLFVFLTFFRKSLYKNFFKPTSSNITLGISQQPSDLNEERIQIIADGLNIPWEIIFLSRDSLLVTERPGTLLHITKQSKQKIYIEGVEHVGEGGLMGAALHPDFEKNNWLYLYLTTKTETGLSNRVDRYNFNIAENKLTNKKTIIKNIPGAKYHDGGRIAFGPDRLLYITTGDAGNPDAAQDKNSLAGKILRITDQGQIPSDNPFNNPVFSYGHRNPQGLAWDNSGNLWITEHGPSGLESGFDEINLINKGQNYGWPLFKGDETEQNFVKPVIHSGATETWAPAGLEIFNQQMFFVGLRGETLYSAQITDGLLTKLTAHFKNEYGRLRVVKLSPDKKWLYIATSNTDGRGTKQTNGDKIIKLSVELF